jgi:two-component system phosphate regulon sensor histidine kinase PhoR
MRTNFLFRETVHSLQASKLKIDKLLIDSVPPAKFILSERTVKGYKVNAAPGQKVVTLLNTLRKKVSDSAWSAETIVLEKGFNEKGHIKPFSKRENRLIQFLYDVDSLQDSIRVNELKRMYLKRLQQQNINVGFDVKKITKGRDEKAFNEVTLGFVDPVTFQLNLGSTLPYLLKRISAAILFSLFLIGFTIFSFSLLYRNLLHQRRLANIKNEFISNITHELKTPIATVSVAIEALRNFSSSLDPQRTKEYLDISANELQRLSLLVDKVLKLSMFEKKEIDLKYEALDMKDLVAEVTTSMRLQFEKHKALVSVTTNGDTTLNGDRLHLVSVIFNLVDNALKYSSGQPQIDLMVKGNDDKVQLVVTDKGIGIPAEYHDRLFEKFFRVPTGNVHNAKGYGLGLSYVSHVVQKHQGTITVESVEGNGASFIITLPKLTA